MQKRITVILVGVLSLLSIGICLSLVISDGTRDPGWGRDELKVSERAYYMSRIGDITEAWRDMAYHARRDRDGRIEIHPFTCLVVDTAAKRLWLESNGRPLPGYEAELPSPHGMAASPIHAGGREPNLPRCAVCESAESSQDNCRSSRCSS